MIDPRSASPHPSLSSSGSEEVRCSLDELDAVIATFDEEAKQCQALTHLRNGASTLISSQHSKRRGSLSLEHTSFAVPYDALDYASATLQNPSRTRSTVESIQANLQGKPDNNPSLTHDDEFPPPPPDAFAPENFILPPPSPPPSSPGLRQSLTMEQNNADDAFSAQCAKNQTKNEDRHGSVAFQNPVIPSTIISNSSCSGGSLSVERQSNVRMGTAGACRRPAVPQRAPSTRLSTMTAPTVQTMEEIRPQSTAFESHSRTTQASSNQQLKSPLSDHVSRDLRPDSPGTDPLIDETVPPVSDIIRQFDRFGTITGTLCRPIVPQTKCTGAAKLEELHLNTATSVLQYPAGITSPEHKSFLSANSFGFTTLKSNGGDQFGVVPSSAVNELDRGFSASRSISIDSSRPINAVPGSSPLIKNIDRISSPSSTTVLNKSLILSDTSAPSRITSPKHLIPDPQFNGHPGSPPLSSFGSIPSSSRKSPPPSAPPPPPHETSSEIFSNLSNLTGHALVGCSDTGCSSPRVSGSESVLLPTSNSKNSTVASGGRAGNSATEILYSGSTSEQSKRLDSHVTRQVTSPLHRQASSENRCLVDSLSVHTMGLDPSTLETLMQYNILEAHQIPGYQPVPNGLPDWKTHKLERKNRVAADAYAADLRKWGYVPQWKRELIEKRQIGKTDSTSARGNTGVDSRSETLMSAELAEKLQRRLEKVAATSES